MKFLTKSFGYFKKDLLYLFLRYDVTFSCMKSFRTLFWRILHFVHEHRCRSLMTGEKCCGKTNSPDYFLIPERQRETMLDGWVYASSVSECNQTGARVILHDGCAALRRVAVNMRNAWIDSCALGSEHCCYRSHRYQTVDRLFAAHFMRAAVSLTFCWLWFSPV